MSISIDINNAKIFRQKMLSLDTSTKVSNSNKSNSSIRAKGSQLPLIQNYSKIILPSINSSINRSKRKTIIGKPVSLMSKLLKNYKPNYSDKIKEEQTIIKLSKLKSRNTRNSLLIKSHSLNNIFNLPRKEMKNKQKSIFITEKDKNEIGLLNNKIRSNNINILDNIKENIFEEDKLNFENNKDEEITNIKSIKTTSENDKDSLINDKDLYSINDRIQKTNSSSVISNNINNKTNDKNITKNMSTVTNSSNSSSLISNNYNIHYKRLRKFVNPFSKEEPKDKNIETRIKNIDITENNNLINLLYENNIKFQAKIFDEQVRLFNGCYKEYKLLNSDINFLEVFKSKTLFTKIKYNKRIEETCSILYYLPKFILKDWHDLMLNLEKIHVPAQKSFISEYIIDENITVKDNNILLTEVIFYFNKSAEFYLLLSKKESEGANVKFNQKNFFKIIKGIKTARHNIIYLINSFNNSKKKYLDDLTLIKKFLIRKNNLNINNSIETKEDEASFYKKIFHNILLLNDEKNKNINAIERIEEQFHFKRDDELEKKKQIETALDIDKVKPIYNHLGQIVSRKKKIYESIFMNKYMGKVLNYCYDNVRDRIIRERVVAQEESMKKNKKNYNPIKFNFQ